MIGLLFGAFMIGACAALVLAPIVMIADRQNINKMKKLIEEFDDAYIPNVAMREKEKRNVKMQLIALKEKIFIGDKKAVATASDLITNF